MSARKDKKLGINPLDVLHFVMGHPDVPHDTRYVADLMVEAAAMFVGQNALTPETLAVAGADFARIAAEEFSARKKPRKVRKGKK